MDKVFKIEKESLINNFKIACSKLGYEEVEINPVTDSITYKAIGKGMQWGTNAVIKVTFTEKAGYTNASFEILKEIRFPLVGKQRIIDKFLKEINDLVDLLNNTINNVIIQNKSNTSDTPDKFKINELKLNPINEEVNKYLDDNKKNNSKKVLIAIVITLLLMLIIFFKGGKENPCNCVEIFSKKEMVGYEGLPGNFKNQYNKCVNNWDNINKANKGCIDKTIKEDGY